MRGIQEPPENEKLAEILAGLAAAGEGRDAAATAAGGPGGFTPEALVGEQLATLRVGADGALEQAIPTFVDPGPTWYRLLDEPEAALSGQHLLALAADTQPEEFEALAVSIWENAGWTEPNTLHLDGGICARGPYCLGRKLGAQLGFSASRVSLFRIPPAPVPAVDAQILAGLERIARRLGGEIKSPGSAVRAPDPDAAVNMTVWAPRALEAARLVEIAATILGDVQGDEAAASAPPVELPPGRMIEDFRGLRAAAIQGMDAAQRAAMHAAADERDIAALSGQLANDETVISGSVGGGAERIGIIRTVATAIPAALRWEQWAEPGKTQLYAIEWIGGAVVQAQAPGALPRRMRVTRLRMADAIEQLAQAIWSETGGAILDQDGFLVDFGEGF